MTDTGYGHEYDAMLAEQARRYTEKLRSMTDDEFEKALRAKEQEILKHIELMNELKKAR